MIDKLAKTPLLYQPGTRWVYSVSMDIQGYIVEKLSGQSLPDFMQQRIFGPLRMKDTGFFVPKEKRTGLQRSTEKTERRNGRQQPRRAVSHSAHDALGRWRYGFDRAGLFALRSDAFEPWRTRWRSHPGAGFGELMTANHLAPS